MDIILTFLLGVISGIVAMRIDTSLQYLTTKIKHKIWVRKQRKRRDICVGFVSYI